MNLKVGLEIAFQIKTFFANFALERFFVSLKIFKLVKFLINLHVHQNGKSIFGRCHIAFYNLENNSHRFALLSKRW